LRATDAIADVSDAIADMSDGIASVSDGIASASGNRHGLGCIHKIPSQFSMVAR
jgi:hypothetical protein